MAPDLRSLLAVLSLTLLSSPSARAAERPIAAEVGKRFQTHETHLLPLSWDQTNWDLSWLPRDLEYPKGKVSLVIDPKDAETAYLIDARGPWKEGERAMTLSFSRPLRREVKTSEGWTLLDSGLGGCGGGYNDFPFKTGECRRMRSPVPISGDAEGTIRYWTAVSDGEHVRRYYSAAFHGSYDPKDLVFGKKFRGYFHLPWPDKASGPDGEAECAATFELLLSYGPCDESRDRVVEDMTPVGSKGLSEDFKSAMQRILKSEWPRQYDRQALVSRCVGIVLGSPARQEKWPFGSPEANPIAAWKLLAEINSWELGQPSYSDVTEAGGEEIYGPMDDPWKLPPEIWSRFAARVSEVAHQPGKIGEIAKHLRFLSGGMIREISTEELVASLASLQGLEGELASQELQRRGERSQPIGAAIHWLETQPKEKAGGTWDWFWTPAPGETKCRPADDAEEFLLATMLEARSWTLLPKMAAESCYGPIPETGRSPALPPKIRSAVINLLRKELDDPSPAYNFSDEGHAPIWVQILGLQMLNDEGTDPEVVDLLKAFLSSSKVERLNRPDGQFLLYPVRHKAAEILVSHGEKVPDDLVLKEPWTAW